jgi:hypothetical protein
VSKLKAIIDSAKRAGVDKSQPPPQMPDEAARQGIRAYHGSPHSFDKFSTSQIGTGEGAQAYGRGLYFAEREKTAEGYRKNLSRDNLAQRAKDNQSYDTLVGLGLDESPELGAFSTILSEADGDMARAIQDSMTPRYPDDPLPAFAQSMADAMKSGRLPASIELPTLNKGSMYEVNIAATPDEFIDWDLPLDEQSESVMNALNKTDWYKYAEEGAYEAAGNRGDNPYGMDLVRWLEEDGAEDAAQMLKDAGIKGIQYADAQTRFGKGPKTKNYVVYDDKLISISKKYGISIPAAAAVLAGTMTPEEAQAGVISIPTQGIRSLGQTLEFDPRFDPRKREQEGLQSLQFDFLPRNEAMIKPSLRLSDLEGEDFVTSMSDRTRAGGMIMGINGVPLYRAVDLRGGQDFMFENPNQVWASARVPSEKILEMAREFQGQSGKDPLFIPWRMAPTGGDFSNMVGELMLGFASSNMDKATKKAFDVAIREYKTKGSMDKGVRKNAGLKIKEWPGVDDPKAVEIWRSTPDAVRKELMNMMDVQFRNKGGLSIGSARLVASDPTQLMSRDAGLQNVGRIYTGQDITPSTHPSYPYAVPGEGIGTLKGADEVTIFDLLPEARFGDAQKKVKDPANPTQQEIRALQMKPYGGTITENILRRIEERGVNVNSLTGLTPGALAFTLTSAGLLTPEEAAAGGLDEAAEIFSGTKGGNQGLVPFDKDIHTSRDVGLGGLSSEYTMTVDAPDGQVAVIPSIWWDTNGEPVVLDQRDAERRSFEYEQETGKQFPRFPAGGYELADEYAQARTRQGGASESPLASEYPSLGGMGVTSRATPDEVAFKAPREPRRIPEKQPPGIASLAGQLGLGAMSEIGGAILGGLSGAAEYVRGSGPSMGGMAGAPATVESIRNINEGVSGYVGDLYDAGPEAQALGQQIMQGIGETIAPIAEYAMEGPITDEYGINMLPLIAQKLGIPLYELLERVYSMMPEREQEALKSGADAFL